MSEYKYCNKIKQDIPLKKFYRLHPVINEQPVVISVLTYYLRSLHRCSAGAGDGHISVSYGGGHRLGWVG